MNDIEVRAIAGHPSVEKRADGTEYIKGTAIVFDQLSQLLGGWFKEQIDSRALEGADMTNVCGLFNHDDSQILARTQSGTLKLIQTQTGLDYEIDIDPNDPDHLRVVAKMRRGDIRGSSFAFVIAAGGADWDTDENGTEIRTVKKIRVLADVSPVTNPAYLQTSAGLGKRSVDSIREEYEQYKEERNKAVEDKVAPVTETAHSEELTRDANEREVDSLTELDLMKMELEM